MKKNKKRNFIVLGIVIVLVACITIMLFQVKGEKKEVVETDQNSYRYIYLICQCCISIFLH